MTNKSKSAAAAKTASKEVKNVETVETQETEYKSKHKIVPIPEKRVSLPQNHKRAAELIARKERKEAELNASENKAVERKVYALDSDDEIKEVDLNNVNPLLSATPTPEELAEAKETKGSKKSSLKTADKAKKEKTVKAPKKERGLSNEAQADKFLADKTADAEILAHYIAVYAGKGITDEKFIKARMDIYMAIARKRAGISVEKKIKETVKEAPKTDKKASNKNGKK